MKSLSLKKIESKVLLILAIAGLSIPNVIFLYYCFKDMSVLIAALRNPIAAVFLAEALFLMVLIAWLLHRNRIKRPSPIAFVIYSLVGSMAFSVPLTLRLLFGDQPDDSPTKTGHSAQKDN